LKSIISFFRQALKISYSEARSFFGLLIVCIIALLIIFISKTWQPSNEAFDAEDARMLDSLLFLIESSTSKINFTFDPNVLSVDSLVLIGFPSNVAERLHKYRSRGGRFHVKADVKKIYGLSDDFYEYLEPYLALPDSLPREKAVGSRLNLNNSTSYQLIEIDGIDRIMAARIERYRSLLGGFVSRKQLQEVYDLEGEALQNLNAQSYIPSPPGIGKIRINHALKQELERHPYISKELAEDIVRFRDINGAIESEKLLANFKSVDKSNFELLILYLDFQ